MRVKIDCYPCILSQLSELAKKAVGDEAAQHGMVKKLMRMVLDADSEITPPELAAGFHAEVGAVSGVADPYRTVKDESTRIGIELLPRLRRIAAEAADPFEAAVRLAIGGNSIDYGVDPNFDLKQAEKRILEVFDLDFDSAVCAELKRRMDKADHIFYMLDNCGEAVIDRLLVEPYKSKITLGVRGKPILNDVTRREAGLSGFDGIEIVDTGDMAPGVSLRNSSPEMLKRMRSADLVISKGQGNFETLGDYDRPIFFLLRVKCQVISRLLRRPVGALEIIGENL
ncbi:MAG: ARMT1-like domain-containing protein [Victivallaceae bacterium]|nr:ARMT1-like domain-containing protein [Victivallaceae bacterium]